MSCHFWKMNQPQIASQTRTTIALPVALETVERPALQFDGLVLALQHFSGCSRRTSNGKQPGMATRLNVQSRNVRPAGPLRARRLLPRRHLFGDLLVSRDLCDAAGRWRWSIAFLVAVSIGFVLHSRWSFRGHGKREDRRMKVKFLARPGLRLPAQRGLHLGADRTDARPDLVAAGPGDLRHAARDLPAQPAVGVRLMERVVYQRDGRARPAPLVVSRAARRPRRPDPARGDAARERPDPRDRLRHRPQSRDARRLRPCRRARARRRSARRSPKSGSAAAVMSAPLARARGRSPTGTTT